MPHAGPATVRCSGSSPFGFRQGAESPVVAAAAEELNRQFVNRQIVDALRSTTYQAILHSIRRTILNSSFGFTRSEMLGQRTAPRLWGNRVSRMRSLGAIARGLPLRRGMHRHTLGSAQRLPQYPRYFCWLASCSA